MTGILLNATQEHHSYIGESVFARLAFDYQVIFQQIGTLNWKTFPECLGPNSEEPLKNINLVECALTKLFKRRCLISFKLLQSY